MRAAIIGCGPWGPQRAGCHSIAYAHAAAMSHAGGAIELVAAASRQEKNVRDFAAEFPGTKGYQDYKKMLAEEHPDFVSVCAFPPDRESMVLAALESGAKTIWVEKPFAISMGAAQRMMQAADRHGARLFVNFQRRFGAPFEWVKEVVSGGKIGRLVSAQVSQPGNKLIDFGPHLIDAVLNIIDAPVSRQAVRVLGAVEWSSTESYQGIPVEAQLTGTIHFSDGMRLSVESGREQAKAVPVIRFDGEQGFVELRLSPVEGEAGIARGCLKGSSDISVFESEENFHHGAIDKNLYVDRALKDILQAVRTGGPSRLDAAAVLPGLEIMLALFESANQQKMVTLPLSAQESPFKRT